MDQKQFSPAPCPPTPVPCFVADEMLGGLARLLRLAGVSCEFETAGERDPARPAPPEGPPLIGPTTIILTRSKRRVALVAPPEQMYYVATDNSYLQMVEVCRAFGIDPSAGALTRCSYCNTPLVRVAPDQAAPEVPAKVLRTTTEFWRCPDCPRLYWEGTHARSILAKLARIREEARGP